MKNRLLTLAALSMYFGINAQVGINTSQAQVTLDVVGFPSITSKLDGIIAPRLTETELNKKTYGAPQIGAMVYVTLADIAPAGQTVNVTVPGYYYFDGTQWQKQTGAEWQVKGNAAGEISTAAETLGTAPASVNYLGTKGVANLVVITAGKVHGVLDTAGGLTGGGEDGSNLAWGSNNTINATSNNIALGRGNTANTSGANFPAVAIGSDNIVAGGGKAFGSGNSTLASNNFAFGANNKTGNSLSAAVGMGNDAINGGFAFGTSNVTTGNNFAFGSTNKVSGISGSIAIGINGISQANQSTYANTAHIFSGQGAAGTVITDVGINMIPSATNYADLEISKAIQIKATTKPTCDASNAGSIMYEVATVAGVTSGNFIGCKQTGTNYGWQTL